MNRAWDRVFRSDKTIPILSVMTVCALFLAVWAVFGVMAGNIEREADRVDADLASCERGNLLRGQVIALGDADQAMVRDILDVVLPVGRDERATRIRAELDPVMERHQAGIDDIELIDCEAVVPGGNDNPPTTEAP